MSNSVKIVILGAAKVGKSAVAVRYLTQRFIGEYFSNQDFIYKNKVPHENDHVQVEILDMAMRKDDTVPPGDELLKWGDAFLIVYSVLDMSSFDLVPLYIRNIQDTKRPDHAPISILGNKTDMGHLRQVCQTEGEELAAEHNCQFQEVSAAESHVTITETFTALIKDIFVVRRQPSRTRSWRQRGSTKVVSRAISNMFGFVNRNTVSLKGRRFSVTKLTDKNLNRHFSPP